MEKQSILQHTQRRLQWRGHMLDMDHQCVLEQVLYYMLITNKLKKHNK